NSEWSRALYLHHSDNLLDNRPALVSTKGGELIVIHSSDGRRQFIPMTYMPGMKTSADEEALTDPYQNDLYMSHVALNAAAPPPAAKPVNPATAGALDPRDQTEQATVARLRGYRLRTASGWLRLLRGEFHRHSEISMDGGNDGSIIDQYRYML